nr:PREDICTED: serine-rich and transmembrane domain-containing protein 1 isoform X1 [Rhinolophus sinicus]
MIWQRVQRRKKSADGDAPTRLRAGLAVMHGAGGLEWALRGTPKRWSSVPAWGLSTHTQSVRFTPYGARVSLFTCFRWLQIRGSFTWSFSSRWAPIGETGAPAVTSRVPGKPSGKPHQLPSPFPGYDETLESCVSCRASVET